VAHRNGRPPPAICGPIREITWSLPRGRRHAVSPQVSRWEYLEVFVNKSEWRDGRGKSGKMPEGPGEDPRADRRGADRRGTGTAAVAGRLAPGGWELVSTIPSGAADVYRLVFKRMKGIRP
jgi:hypothetical protein